MDETMRLLAKALEEADESLCNILWCAACYLEQAGEPDEYGMAMYKRKAEVLRKYSDLMFAEIQKGGEIDG